MNHARHFSAAALACALLVGTPFAVEPAQAQQRSTQATALRVTGFDVEQVDRLEPGAELNFTVWGTPGGQASVQLQGSQPANVVLDEVRAGEYVGRHALPQDAWVDTQQPLVAQLRLGSRTTRTSIDNAYAGVDGRASRSGCCADCATVQALNEVVVDGEGKVLGREIQRRHNQRTPYEVVLRSRDGLQRSVVYNEMPPFRVGDTVRVVGETLEPYPR